MIRAISIAALACLLVLVLYLPSAYPPTRFLAQIQADHRAVARYWGEEAALEILESALARQQGVQDVAPIPSAYDAPSIEHADGVVAKEMSSVNQRLFNSPYFRAVDAMLLLAVYRATLSLKWTIWLLAFPLTMMVDSLAQRRVKALEIVQHDPEVFSVLVAGAIATACATILLLVVPYPLHPVLLPIAPLVVLTLVSRAVASFHAKA